MSGTPVRSNRLRRGDRAPLNVTRGTSNGATSRSIRTTSVVVCTRNRPEGVLSTVRSVMSDAPNVEVVVVDQSDSQDTRWLLEHEVPSVRIVASEPRGLAAARNMGVAHATGEIIAFTDDDCEVRRGWLDAMRNAFAREERIGLVFGKVLASDYDRGAGFVPSYDVPAFIIADRLAQKTKIEGMGACMAVRRDAWRELGGFDEALGSGASFRAGEDTDFAVRSLVSGFCVAETPDAMVVHNGFRTWAQGRDLIAGYMYGLGAVNAKMLRLGGWRAVRPLSILAWRWLAGAPVVDLNQKPPRFARLVAFLRGAFEGLRVPVSPTGRFS